MSEKERYVIRDANPTGGKAGKGNNLTSTIQVFDTEESSVIKSFRYDMHNTVSRMKAKLRASMFIEELEAEKE